MTPKEKIKAHFQSRIIKSFPSGTSWAEWYERAERTEELNYKCGFNDGSCRKSRENPDNTLTKVGCCCTHCKTYRGYINCIEEQELETYLNLWNCRTGFFRKGKGCVLPRKLRSRTCLGYNCRENTFDSMLISYLDGRGTFEEVLKHN